MNDYFENPIFAAVRCQEELLDAILSPVSVLFVLNANILFLEKEVQLVHKHHKYLFVHMDLTEGIGKDLAGITYLARIGVDGIISTRNQMIRYGKECGLTVIQRFFIVDSQSVDTAVEAVRALDPDMVEVMPGVVPKTIKKFCEYVDLPVIAGGLIENKQEIIQALGAGASAISTASKELWGQ